jgi:diguanylate cyclase (GGDEF)-like protein
MGGDEFAILMPNTHDADCMTKLRDLCVMIELKTAAAGCAVTASIGCKTFLSPPDDSAEAVGRADKLMYEAKLRGKNRAQHAELVS